MTDPTPQTTPTRDEAVREPFGYTSPEALAALNHKDTLLIWPGYWPGAVALYSDPPSAPAPASGVDAVAWQTVSDFVDEMLRDWAGGDDCRMGFGLNGATVTKGQFRAVQAALASLSPAATPRSEVEPVAIVENEGPAPIDVRFTEACGYGVDLPHGTKLYTSPAATPVEVGGEPVAWRAVAHPETRMGTMVSEIRHRLIEDADSLYGKGRWDLQELGALAKPASSPAVADLRALLDHALSVLDNYADPTGYTDNNGEQLSADESSHPGILAQECAAETRAALSQSTSAGRGE